MKDLFESYEKRPERSPRDLYAAAVRRNNFRFEEKLIFEIRAYGLPDFHRNYRWAKSIRSQTTGRPRQFEADVFFPVQKLIVEIQGGIWRADRRGHAHPLNVERDIEKMQCAVLLGYAYLPMTTTQVQRGEGISILVRAMYALGWRPKE